METNQATLLIHTSPDIVKYPQLPLPGMPPGTMRHHNVGRPPYLILRTGNIGDLERRYGVASDRRVLPPSVFFKRFDRIRQFLGGPLGLTPAQCRVLLRLLAYWAYYGRVYAKAASISTQEGCHKATFWRTVRLLRERGLITVINRFFLRPDAQTSNLYRFDKLLIMIARYLAEHGVHFWAKWLQPYLTMTGTEFWHGWVRTGFLPCVPAGDAPTV